MGVLPGLGGIIGRARKPFLGYDLVGGAQNWRRNTDDFVMPTVLPGDVIIAAIGISSNGINPGSAFTSASGFTLFKRLSGSASMTIMLGIKEIKSALDSGTTVQLASSAGHIYFVHLRPKTGSGLPKILVPRYDPVSHVTTSNPAAQTAEADSYHAPLIQYWVGFSSGDTTGISFSAGVQSGKEPIDERIAGGIALTALGDALVDRFWDMGDAGSNGIVGATILEPTDGTHLDVGALAGGAMSTFGGASHSYDAGQNAMSVTPGGGTVRIAGPKITNGTFGRFAVRAKFNSSIGSQGADYQDGSSLGQLNVLFSPGSTWLWSVFEGNVGSGGGGSGWLDLYLAGCNGPIYISDVVIWPGG